MSKWNLIIDVAKCFNCNLCALACHDEYYDNDFPGVAASMPRRGHRWIEIHQKERGQYPMVDVVYLPVTCNHCDEPPCQKAATNGAVTKRADGIVLIDPVKAKGQEAIAEACPYKAVFWNDETNIPQIWPFDAHLLDSGWTKTRGTQVCPTQAMRSVKLDDRAMRDLATQEKLEPLHPEFGTKPRVWYKNLARWQKALVGGTVAGPIKGVVECVAGARVSLEREGQKLGEALTDTFGDFRLDGLDLAGGYRLSVSAPGFADQAVAFDLTDSTYLGTITLVGR
ncbi:MAG: carboxypeptidase regulatory-like domain-containing protein [Rhodospirillales bacterium]|nr:carboxypeptidase regulatory-like domain-containing protein [Rhodospirillales bacterium]